ncbi:MAG TPA: MurR/RpiR family transcriptional regulator [Pseudonocardia sp.]|nr:MurR/RpiR family transcriptional regulator [Pseudonocardia sp.]
MATPNGADFADYVSARLPDLAPAEQQVVRFVLANPSEVLFLTAGELGDAAGTSDATVVRTAKTLGYSGLPELRRHLGQSLTRETAPSRRLGVALERIGTAHHRSIDQAVTEGVEQIQEMYRRLQPADLEVAVHSLLGARQVFTWGLGTSGLAAEYAATRLTRRGLLVRHSADTGFRLADALLPLTGDDAVLAYLPGNLNRDAEALFSQAARVGADVVLVTSSLSARLSERVLVTLPAPMADTKVTGEILTASLVTDILVTAIAGRTVERSTATAELLTQLRGELGEKPVRARGTRRRQP